jgi:hypothetical protein
MRTSQQNFQKTDNTGELIANFEGSNVGTLLTLCFARLNTGARYPANTIAASKSFEFRPSVLHKVTVRQDRTNCCPLTSITSVWFG